MSGIYPLTLDTIDALGPYARRCDYWETDIPEGARSTDDPEFEKEAWISRVLLDWGVCGQYAKLNGRPVAAAFYAPPGMVPRADCLPTSPVGSDAIVLTGIPVEKDAPAAVRTDLIAAVVADLRVRGIKAIESFGHTAPENSSERCPHNPCGLTCLTPVNLLIEHGFDIVAEHQTLPRLRLEIDTEHLWKEDVERALDQLFAERGIPTRRIGQLAGVTASTNRVDAARSR